MMADEKDKSLAEKIEKLIVDGQKEVLEGLRRVAEEVKDTRVDVAKLDKKIDSVHTSLKKEIISTAYALKDDVNEVGKKVEEVDRKLGEHIRLPAHA